MGRFDSPELVAAWLADGTYPVIHQGMYSWVRENVGPGDGAVLDLCSSSGLLARRLARAGYQTAAVTMPGPALTLGKDAGVYDHTPVLELRISPAELPELDRWVRAQKVRTIVARRALPELHDALGDVDFSIMAEMWADAGVRTVLVEGRMAAGRSAHPLRSVAHEVDALGARWRREALRGNLAMCTLAS